MPSVRLRVDPALWFLVRRERRASEFAVEVTATDTVGHVVQMVGIPLTEVGGLRLDGRDVPPRTPLDRHAAVPAVVEVLGRTSPQAAPSVPPRFLLDVHLGALARSLRLLGLDAAYETDAQDGHLVERAEQEQRVLLSRDRGLLSRSALGDGALVRAERPQEQVEEMLRRFVPPLAPWTRCLRCNALLRPATTEEVAAELEPGTRRSYRDFSRCEGCRRVYWRGAHSGPLEEAVRRAEEVLRHPGR